jgi:hypothetical protein
MKRLFVSLVVLVLFVCWTSFANADPKMNLMLSGQGLWHSEDSWAGGEFTWTISREVSDIDIGIGLNAGIMSHCFRTLRGMDESVCSVITDFAAAGQLAVPIKSLRLGVVTAFGLSIYGYDSDVRLEGPDDFGNSQSGFSPVFKAIQYIGYVLAEIWGGSGEMLVGLRTMLHVSSVPEVRDYGIEVRKLQVWGIPGAFFAFNADFR